MEGGTVVTDRGTHLRGLPLWFWKYIAPKYKDEMHVIYRLQLRPPIDCPDITERHQRSTMPDRMNDPRIPSDRRSTASVEWACSFPQAVAGRAGGAGAESQRPVMHKLLQRNLRHL